MEATGDQALARAHLLYDASRLEESLAACREALAADPEDADAHALAGWCHLGRGRADDALEATMRAIRAAPEWAESRRLLAAVQVQRGEMNAARGAIEEAIRLDPEDPAYPAFLADLHADERRWSDSLEASARALALDPWHEYARVVRAHAQVRSGRVEEGLAEARRLLEQDPDHPRAHQVLGWGTLAKGDAGDAQEHFSTALRLDPSSGGARDGLVEALKARRGLYRPLLAWKTTMDRFTAGEQLAVVAGLALVVMAWPTLLLGAMSEYPLLQALAAWTADRVPALQTVGGTIDVVLSKAFLAFMLLTWTGDPILHLVLMRERRLRFVLSREEIVAALVFAGVALLAVVGGAYNAATLGAGAGLAAFLALAAQVVPAPNAVRLPAGLPRAVGFVLATALLACALYGASGPHVAALGALPGGIGTDRALAVATWGGILSSWALNLLTVLPQRRARRSVP